MCTERDGRAECRQFVLISPPLCTSSILPDIPTKEFHETFPVARSHAKFVTRWERTLSHMSKGELILYASVVKSRGQTVNDVDDVTLVIGLP